MTRRPPHDARRPRKARFLIDHDASGTAQAVRAMGWSAYAVNPNASDAENVEHAVQRGLSILSMDTDFGHFSLQSLPFTVILSGNAQNSMATATAQLHLLNRLMRTGQVNIAVCQRVTITTDKVRVETPNGTRVIDSRISKTTRRRKSK